MEGEEKNIFKINFSTPFLTSSAVARDPTDWCHLLAAGSLLISISDSGFFPPFTLFSSVYRILKSSVAMTPATLSERSRKSKTMDCIGCSFFDCGDRLQCSNGRCAVNVHDPEENINIQRK